MGGCISVEEMGELRAKPSFSIVHSDWTMPGGKFLLALWDKYQNV